MINKWHKLKKHEIVVGFPAFLFLLLFVTQACGPQENGQDTSLAVEPGANQSAAGNAAMVKENVSGRAGNNHSDAARAVDAVTVGRDDSRFGADNTVSAPPSEGGQEQDRLSAIEEVVVEEIITCSHCDRHCRLSEGEIGACGRWMVENGELVRRSRPATRPARVDAVTRSTPGVSRPAGSGTVVTGSEDDESEAESENDESEAESENDD